MLYFFRQFLARLSLLLFLYISTGCHSKSEEVSAVYKSYKFDPKVIEKLPIYDSLASAILEKFLFFNNILMKMILIVLTNTCLFQIKLMCSRNCLRK